MLPVEHVTVEIYTLDDHMFTMVIDKIGGMRPGPVPGTVSFGRTEVSMAEGHERRTFTIFHTIPLENLSQVYGNVHSV